MARSRVRSSRKRVRRLERAGELDAALAKARAMVARHPEDPESHLTLGELYLRLGDSEAAAAALDEAWQAAPRSRKWKVAGRVARGLAEAGRPEEALELLRPLDATMAAGPLSVERASLERRLGRSEEAVAELAAGLEENPYYEPAWDALVDLLEDLGRSDEARDARARRAAVPRKRSAAEVVEAVAAAFPADAGPYVVNLGCRDGK